MEVRKRRGLGIIPKQEEQQAGIGRIANGLSRGLAARRQLNIFDIMEDKNEIEKLRLSDERLYIDRKGKNIYLTNDEQDLIMALSARIPFGADFVKEGIKELEDLDTGKSSIKPRNVTIPFSIVDLAKDIIGDTKEASIKKIGERLIRLSETEQAIPYFVGGKKFLLARPLIKIDEKIYECYSMIRSGKGKRKPTTGTTEEERILIAANVEFPPIFIQEANNKYCPIYTDKYFKVARKNKTEMFRNILSDLQSKWRQYYINSIKEVTQTAKQNKELKATNRAEYDKLIAEVRSEALKYKSSTLTIRDGLKRDYESTPKKRAEFIPDLQRAINSLVEYGIITEQSNISKDKTNVIFYYNPDFANNDKENILLPNESDVLLE